MNDKPSDPVSEAAPPDAIQTAFEDGTMEGYRQAMVKMTPLIEVAERDLADARRERDALRKERDRARGAEKLARAFCAQAEQDEALADAYSEKLKARAAAAEATLARRDAENARLRTALEHLQRVYQAGDSDEPCVIGKCHVCDDEVGWPVETLPDWPPLPICDMCVIKEALAGDPEGTPLCDPRCGGSISTWHVATCPNAPAWLKGTVSPAPALSLSMTDDPLAISALLDDSTRERERYHRIIARIREVLGEDGLHAQLLDLPDLVAQKLAVAPAPATDHGLPTRLRHRARFMREALPFQFDFGDDRAINSSSAEAVARLLDEAAEALRPSFRVYQCEEWQCRYVFPDNLCCIRPFNHDGEHRPVEARGPVPEGRPLDNIPEFVEPRFFLTRGALGQWIVSYRQRGDQRLLAIAPPWDNEQVARNLCKVLNEIVYEG